MNMIYENLFKIKDHMEDEEEQLKDLLICLYTINAGFEHDPGDKKVQEISCIRVTCRLIQEVIDELQADREIIEELLNDLMEEK